MADALNVADWIPVVTEPRNPYSKSILETTIWDSWPDPSRKGATQ
jgi:hypothetical protein